MAEFLLGAAGFVLAMVALGLVRILRGPTAADRIMRRSCSAPARLRRSS